MRSAIKKLFDWTPRDIAYWEKIQQRGLGNFIAMYGVVITGGLLFLVFGFIRVIGWLRLMQGIPVTTLSWLFLFGQLLFIATVCIAGGVINSLITWLVEERLYRKYKQGK